jgi:hypothetical protein
MSDTHVISPPAAAPTPPNTSLHEPRPTEAQALSMADALLASARATAELAGEDFDQAGTEAQIRQALAEHGFDAEFDHDTRTPEERAHDAHFAPAGDASAYRPHLSPSRPLLDGQPAERVEQIRAELGDVALAAELSPDIGTAFLDAALNSAETTGTFRTPEARAQYKAEQVAALQRIAGSQEAYDGLVAAAQRALGRANAGTVRALNEIGALDSAEVILTIAHDEQRREVRARG